MNPVYFMFLMAAIYIAPHLNWIVASVMAAVMTVAAVIFWLVSEN